MSVKFEISFTGLNADERSLDFYDAARALMGFERSLALTAHLILNDQLITQAPSLAGARILIYPPSEGSWKITAVVIAAIWTVGSTSKESPFGNILYSAYDYVIKESLGFHVDYNKTLGVQIEEYRALHPKAKNLHQGRFDSLAEKCIPAIKDMHRPIAFSRSASQAAVTQLSGSEKKLVGIQLNEDTYEYISEEARDTEEKVFCGSIAGYYKNSFAGRVFLPELQRSVSFWLTENARSRVQTITLAESLSISVNQNTNHSENSEVCLSAFAIRSKSGRLKKLIVSKVLSPQGSIDDEL